MKKKKICFIIIAIVSLILIISIYVILKQIREKNKWSYVYALTESFFKDWDPEVLVYGEEYTFNQYAKCKRINEITEKSVGEFTNQYKCILLIDIEGTIELSDEELLLIKKLCEDDGLDMYYVGNNRFGDFVRLGFSGGFDEDELGFMYIGSEDFSQYGFEETDYFKPRALHGLFDTSDGELNDPIALQMCIFFMMDSQCEHIQNLKN